MAFDVQKMKPTDLDLSKIASSAGNAQAGNFVKVNESIFSSPGLEFKDRGDGTVAIINNGQVIGFTVIDENPTATTPTEPTEVIAGNVDVRAIEADTEPEVPAPVEETPAVEEKIEVLEEEPEVAEVPKDPEPEVPAITIETTPSQSGRDRSVDVPTAGQNGLTRDYTNYDYYFNKWTDGSRQRKMADLWDSSGRQQDADKGIAMYNGRYIIAMTETFGQVGDEVDVVLEDGTVVPCVLGDIKSMSDPNCTQYGHKLGGGPVSCVEWETTRPMDDASVLGDWRSQKVIQVINTGTTVV